MNKENFTISVIFPTLNEGENLKFLIPDFISEFNNLGIQDYELIVVDDGSSDGTENILFQINDQRINLIKRTKNPSLPLSIWEGIESANMKYVMWLDADGSMSAKHSVELIKKQMNKLDSVIVGSRFVEGGGYKGTLLNEKNKLFNALKNLRNSEDSFVAMFLSLVFNKILSILSTSPIEDMTSGFIIGKKENFSIKPFEKAFYGDYFVYLINELNKKNIEIIEVGYKCGLRKHGVSKTGSSLIGLFRLGRPYIKAAINSRRS